MATRHTTWTRTGCHPRATGHSTASVRSFCRAPSRSRLPTAPSSVSTATVSWSPIQSQREHRGLRLCLPRRQRHRRGATPTRRPPTRATRRPPAMRRPRASTARMSTCVTTVQRARGRIVRSSVLLRALHRTERDHGNVFNGLRAASTPTTASAAATISTIRLLHLPGVGRPRAVQPVGSAAIPHDHP